MKLRDKIALKAMKMVYLREKDICNRALISKEAYLVADAMLEARKLKKE